jgi:putative glutamine amidotransferase
VANYFFPAYKPHASHLTEIISFVELFEALCFDMDKRPRIGLTMRLEMETQRFYLGRDYCEGIAGCGGLPVHIGLIPDADYISDVLDGLDGILLPGSNTDVDPLRYGQEPMPQLGTVIPEKDATDLLVLAEAERRKMPVFGICFGMQIMNVFYGGTLYQDVYTQIKDCLKHEQGKPVTRNSHSIEIEPGSLAHKLAGQDHARVNTSHHQAVDRIGRHLQATAWSADGIVEAIESTKGDHFLLGVQWHPELTWNTEPLSRAIFEAFVGKAREYKRLG